VNEEIVALEQELFEKQKHLAKLKRDQAPVPVEDYILKTRSGETHLSSLFGDKADLIVIHNMGKSCPYCTLWADGINGLAEHLRDRAALVLVSPDPPEVQSEFAASRNWSFPLASGEGSSFIEDMGFKHEKGWMPGVSTFRNTPAGKIERVAQSYFGPGDVFCSLWHFFDLLADGPSGWQPKFGYESKR